MAEEFWAGSGLGCEGRSSAQSSEKMEEGEELREEGEEHGKGEPSGEFARRGPVWRPGDWGQWMTEGRSFHSSPLGLELRLSWATRFFFSRGDMTCPAGDGMEGRRWRG